MIYIRIELWPFGYRELSKLLGEAVICNDGTGTKAVGNYTATLSKRGGFGKASILQHAEKLRRSRKRQLRARVARVRTRDSGSRRAGGPRRSPG